MLLHLRSFIIVTMQGSPLREELVTLVTAPNEDEAARIARALVESRLAACVNMVRDIRSVYCWKGNIEDDREVLMIIKTKRSLFEPLMAKVKDLHSYDVPEVIALPIIAGSEEYLGWLRESTQ